MAQSMPKSRIRCSILDEIFTPEMQSSPAKSHVLEPCARKTPTNKETAGAACVARCKSPTKRVDVQSGCRLTVDLQKGSKAQTGGQMKDERVPNRDRASSSTYNRPQYGDRCRKLSGPDGSSWLLSWSCMTLAYVSESRRSRAMILGFLIFDFSFFGASLPREASSGCFRCRRR